MSHMAATTEADDPPCIPNPCTMVDGVLTLAHPHDPETSEASHHFLAVARDPEADPAELARAALSTLCTPHGSIFLKTARAVLANPMLARTKAENPNLWQVTVCRAEAALVLRGRPNPDSAALEAHFVARSTDWDMVDSGAWWARYLEILRAEMADAGGTP